MKLPLLRNAADTLVAVDKVKVHAPMPPHPAAPLLPCQPTNTQPGAGRAVKVTLEAVSNS